MDVKVSIIIPIYNGYQFLPRLLDCLIKQTYTNIEVIMVDDYSTDESYSYLCEKTKDDARFRILKPDTKGGTASVNIEYALKYVTGDYYFYLSQDDFMDYDCIEKCVTKAEVENADIVIPNCILFYSNEKQEKQSSYPLNGNYKQVLSNVEAFNLSINWKIHGFVLKKVSLFKKTGFDGKYLNSDELYVRYHYYIANKICFSDTNFYYYQGNENSITKHFTYKHIDFLTTMLLVFQFAEENHLEQDCLDIIFSLLFNLYAFYVIKIITEEFTKTEKKYYKNALKHAKCKMKKITSILKNRKKETVLFFVRIDLRLIKLCLLKGRG